MSTLLELAERCEAAEAGDQYDLLLEAHLLVRGLNRYVEPGFKSLLNAGAYLDAAMTLVPEGWDWGAGFGVDPQDHEQMAWAWCGRGEGPYRVAATPALALCAAALRARAAQ